MKKYLYLIGLTIVMGFGPQGRAESPMQGDEIENSIGMRMVYIPPGKFLMGSPESEQGRESQEVQHRVDLTRGFYLGVHEVTVGQFKQFMREENYQTDAEKDGKGSWGPSAETGSIELNNKFIWKSPGFEQSDDQCRGKRVAGAGCVGAGV